MERQAFSKEQKRIRFIYFFFAVREKNGFKYLHNQQTNGTEFISPSVPRVLEEACRAFCCNVDFFSMIIIPLPHNPSEKWSCSSGQKNVVILTHQSWSVRPCGNVQSHFPLFTVSPIFCTVAKS